MGGTFITVEGGEGAGKTTQLHLLAAALRARGHDVLTTREPGGTPGAEAIRTLLLDGAQDFSPLADTLLHFAARADHVDRIVRPALAAGRIVLCDRFFDSTRVYQGDGLGAEPAAIETLISLIGLRPALTLVFDVSEATARARLAARDATADRYERLGAGFHARVATGFRALAAAEPDRCLLVPAEASPETVHAAVLGAVAERLHL